MKRRTGESIAIPRGPSVDDRQVLYVEVSGVAKVTVAIRHGDPEERRGVGGATRCTLK